MVCAPVPLYSTVVLLPKVVVNVFARAVEAEPVKPSGLDVFTVPFNVTEPVPVNWYVAITNVLLRVVEPLIPRLEPNVKVLGAVAIKLRTAVGNVLCVTDPVLVS